MSKSTKKNYTFVQKDILMVNNRIIVDLERLRYPNSGLANVCKNLAKGLNDIAPTCDITLFGPESALKELNTSFPIKAWKNFHKFYTPFLKNYAIIHTTHQLSSYFHRTAKNSIKILTLHDLNFLYENLSEKKKNKFLSKVNAQLKNTDYLVCISQFVKEDVLKNKNLLHLNNIKEIFVIHNGITLPEKRLYNWGRFAFLQNKSYILNIGVLFEKKNQISLIEMLPYIEEDLVLVASGEKEPYASKVRKRIEELELTHRVHFLSNITEEEKYALLQHCRAYCHPSTAEGFGIPPIEAMSFGKATFISTFTSLPEIGGEHAFYFQNFNPREMAAFFQEKIHFFEENRATLEKNIKDWSLQFDHQIMAKNYLDLYQKLCTI